MILFEQSLSAEDSAKIFHQSLDLALHAVAEALA